MKVGILGANGFVGKHICLKFLENNFQVIAFFHKNKSSIPEKCQKVHFSKFREYHMDIFIIAIGSHSSDYVHFLEQYRLIDDIVQSSNFDKLVFISSTEVYGESHEIISLNSCFNNPGIYGQSKIAQEFLIKSINKYTIIRPTYLFGDGMNQNSLIPIWQKSSRESKKILIYGNGDRKQDYMHIDDLAELCYLSSLSSDKQEILLAATGHSYSNLAVAKAIRSTENESKIVFSGEDNKLSSQYDISNTLSEYDFIPRINIIEWLKLKGLK